MLSRLFGVSLVFTFFGVSPAMAQLPKFELEPYVGVYIPINNVIDQDFMGTQVTASQKSGFAMGGRLTFWALGPIGFEGNFVYSWSDAEITEDGQTDSESGNVWAGDLRAIWKLLPGPIGIHIDGGIAYIGRGGDAYSDITDGKSDVGGVVGAGLRFKLPGLFGIRADADAYLYEAEFTVDADGTPVTTDKQFQIDLVLSAGLVIGLGL